MINKRLPEKIKCDGCGKYGMTVVEKNHSGMQIALSTVFCLIVILCWYCAYHVWMNEDYLDYVHSCANCNSKICTY